jgi:phospholipid/cholesterol/gamma-HCH transport system substrate-binding protein
MAIDEYHDAARVRARWLIRAGLLLVVATLSILAVGLRLKHSTHSLRISACFQDVHGLRSSAPVRIAGVDVGTVVSVRAQPANSTCSAYVEMALRTDYPLSIPIDAVASINTAGILGSTYVAIDATHSSGADVVNGGQIPSRETASADVTLEGLARVLQVTGKTTDQAAQKGAATGATNPADPIAPLKKPRPN